MNVDIYRLVNELQFYDIEYFNGDLTIADVRKIYNNNNFVISDKDLEFLKNFLKSNDRDKVFHDYLVDDYKNMSEDEVIESIMQFADHDIFDKRLVDPVENKTGLIAKIAEQEDEGKRFNLASIIKVEELLTYINKNEKGKIKILKLISSVDNPDFLRNIIEQLEQEDDKVVAVLYSKYDEKEKFLPLLNNEYYKTLVTEQIFRNLDEDYLIERIKDFEYYNYRIGVLDSEEDKVKYINQIGNIQMRLEFLRDVKQKDNRDVIINGLQPESDPQIEPYVALVQNMIKEFFEDNYSEKFDEEKREKLEIIFRSNDVFFDKLDDNTNGKADYIDNNIIIEKRHQKNSNLLIGLLLHEYSHAMSNFSFKYNAYPINKTTEEGAADTFADLVMNHYLQKHGCIELEGRKLRVDNPYQVYSGYDFENAWYRTILSGLTSKEKDKEAICDYLLGEKADFANTIFGVKETERRIDNEFNIPSLSLDYDDLYDSEFLDYSNIDFDSIYAKRNYILPLFELQNRLNQRNAKINVISVPNTDEAYSADFVGCKYFNNRKMYEISRDEFKEFSSLINKLQRQNNENGNVIGLDDYYNRLIDELNDDEINENSFKILDSFLGMYQVKYYAGRNYEHVARLAIEKEIELVENGQEIDKSLKKYISIIPGYLNVINPQDGDSNVFICDAINDLKSTYLNQISLEIENGNWDKVIDSLKKDNSNEIYLDSDIQEIFENYGIALNFTATKKAFSERKFLLDSVKTSPISLIVEAKEQLEQYKNKDEKEKNYRE